MDIDTIIKDVRFDMEYEGLDRYQAHDHFELYLKEFSSMEASDAADLLLKVLKKDEYMDAWVAAVLDSLHENMVSFNLMIDGLMKFSNMKN